MMRNFFLYFLMLVAQLGPLSTLHSTCVRAPDTLRATSDIRAATVYLEGARVQRSATVDYPAGRSVLLLTGLTKDLDPASVRISSTDEALTILSVTHRMNFGESPNVDVQAGFVRQLKQLDRQEAAIRAMLGVMNEEKEILRANRSVAGAESGIDFQNLQATVDFQRKRLQGIARYHLAASDTLQQLTDRRERLQEDWLHKTQIAIPATYSEIVVELDAPQNNNGEFQIAYVVADAGWSPVYDVRVSQLNQPVDLRYRANVHQHTDEPWDNIELTLSTGDPSGNSAAPQLTPWQLYRGSTPPGYRPPSRTTTPRGNYRSVNGYVRNQTGESLIGASIQVVGTSIGTITNSDGFYEIDVPLNAQHLEASYTGYNDRITSITVPTTNIVLNDIGLMLEEVVVTGRASRRGKKDQGQSLPLAKSTAQNDMVSQPLKVKTTAQATTVSFHIELPYTIPDDGRGRQVEIKRLQLPASYTHFAVPKFEEAAYLQAILTKWDQYHLITGPANLFFEGTFLGETLLDVEQTNDSLQIDLGRDPSVVVSRETITTFRGRDFLGSKIKASRGFKLSVRNKRAEPVIIVTQDQIPVSTDVRIEVEHEVTGEEKLDEERGIITYRTTVPPSGSWDRTFKYTVRYPRNLPLRLE